MYSPVMAQHLDAGGASVSRWPAAGLPVSAVERQKTGGVLSFDGMNGAYLVWDEYIYPWLAHEGLHRMRPTRLDPVGALDVESQRPTRLAPSAPAPQPARGAFTLRASLPDASGAALAVFDVTGRGELTSELRGAGEHVVPLDATALASGVHWVRLTHASGVRMARVVVVR